MVGIGAFQVFMRIILNIVPYSPLKPTKVGFIFFGSNSLSRAEDLAAVNHVTQAVVRVGSKIGRGVRWLLFRGGGTIWGPPLGNSMPPPSKTPFLKKY